MIAALLVTKGEDSGKSFRLVDGETQVLGRSSRTDIIIQDVGISRQHCTVRLSGGELTVRDLNSKNGTVVNGLRIRGETPLRNGDLIELGRSVLKVEIQHMATGAAPAPAKPAEAPAVRIEAPPLPIHIEEPIPVEPLGDDQGSEEQSLMGAFEHFLEVPTAEEQPADPLAGLDEPEKPKFAIQPVEPPAAAAPLDQLVDKVIAGCRVEEMIGQDEISLIYRGTQLSMERPVALKILLPQMTDDSRAVERFITAARAGGKLNHPNIVQIFDAGEEDGRYFIALELVDGKPVSELLQERGRKRALEPEPALDIATQIADALAYAHARSLVHRNITPENILVTRHGIAKLANLGFLQSLEDSGIERPSRPGEQVDALYFSAPETLSNPSAAGPLADIYSLAAVLFLMLSGHPPFRGANELEILEKVHSGRHESLKKLQGSLPDELIRVVDRALAARPDQRCQTAADFERDLRNMLEMLRR